MRLSYRVSTSFNWYARPVMQLLLGNLAAGNLRYYRERSEAVEGSNRVNVATGGSSR